MRIEIKHFWFHCIFKISDPCTPEPCQNGGVCSRDGYGSYTCDCTSTKFTGVNCTIGNE